VDRAATKPNPTKCLRHFWELGEDIFPCQTKIAKVKGAFGFSVHCTECDERAMLRSDETCPYCFTSMEHKLVDTEVSRFVSRADDAFAKGGKVTIHTCPTCDFKCVLFGN
jgi:hypothetical protein